MTVNVQLTLDYKGPQLHCTKEKIRETEIRWPPQCEVNLTRMQMF